MCVVKLMESLFKVWREKKETSGETEGEVGELKGRHPWHNVAACSGRAVGQSNTPALIHFFWIYKQRHTSISQTQHVFTNHVHININTHTHTRWLLHLLKAENRARGILATLKQK